MRYLSKEEIINRVIAKEFVIEDPQERERQLNKMCLIQLNLLTDEEKNKKFPTRYCGGFFYNSLEEFEKASKESYFILQARTNECIRGMFVDVASAKFPTRQCNGYSYSSWAEFQKQDLDRKNKECSEELEKYSTKHCGVFYYSSVKEFHEKNPNCCEVINLTPDERYSAGEPSQLEIISGKLFGFNFSGTRVRMNILKKDERFNERFNSDFETKSNPKFLYLRIYFRETNYCGDFVYDAIEAITEEGYKSYQKRFINNKNSEN